MVHIKWSKIDRSLVNLAWLNPMPSCVANFLTSGMSDHSPVLIVWNVNHIRLSPFRFDNKWALIPGFSDLVASSWNEEVHGDSMYIVCKKIKRLKLKL